MELREIIAPVIEYLNILRVNFMQKKFQAYLTLAQQAAKVAHVNSCFVQFEKNVISLKTITEIFRHIFFMPNMVVLSQTVHIRKDILM